MAGLAGLGASCAQAEELAADGTSLADRTAAGTTGEAMSGAAGSRGEGSATHGSATAGTGGGSSGATGRSAAGGGALTGAGGFGGAGGLAQDGGIAGAAGKGTGSIDAGADRRESGGSPEAASDAGPTCSKGCALKVEYQNVVSPPEPMTNTVRVRIDIVNAGTNDVLLTDVVVRYWFTDGAVLSDKIVCYYTAGSCNDITTKIVAVNPARPKADRYLEIAFVAAGSLVAGADTGTISVGVQHVSTNAAPYDQSDDYSYGADQPNLVEWPKITAYVGKSLEWGIEP